MGAVAIGFYYLYLSHMRGRVAAWKGFTYAVGVVVWWFALPVIFYMFAPLQCITFQDGNEYMAFNPTLQCDKDAGEHLIAIIVGAVLAGLWCVAILFCVVEQILVIVKNKTPMFSGWWVEDSSTWWWELLLILVKCAVVFMHRIDLDPIKVVTISKFIFVAILVMFVYVPPTQCVVVKQTFSVMLLIKALFLGTLHHGYSLVYHGGNFQDIDFIDAILAATNIASYSFLLFQMLRVAAYLAVENPAEKRPSSPPRKSLNARYRKADTNGKGGALPYIAFLF